MERLPHHISVGLNLHLSGILQDGTLIPFVWVEDGSDELGDPREHAVLLDQSELLESLAGIIPQPLEEGYSKDFSAFVVTH